MASSGTRYMSVDVECVATGARHDAREVCSVAVVDGDANVVLSKKVRPESAVMSYLTPLTGVRKGDLDHAERLSDVIAQVKGLLGADVVLVGQGVKSDIEWLKLQQGRDYASSVDLGEMFKAYNQRYGSYNYFPLSHEANTLIRPGFISEPHDPNIDAIASMKLFKTYHGNQRELERAKSRLLSSRAPMSFAKRNNYHWEGVCMAAYYPQKCFCGAPTKRN